jgi:hypothetical protein
MFDYSLFSILYSLFSILYSLFAILYSLFSIHNSLFSILIHYFQIALAPMGTQACTFDIAKFHRTCPVLPDHKPWLVVQGRPGEFYIEHCHPFGLASSSSNAGMIGNAVVDIWAKEGVAPVCKYEDDLKVFRFPVENAPFQEGVYSYSYDRDDCVRRILALGVPWHPDKGDLRFLFITDYIGFRWDIPQRLVSLSPPKRLKFLERVRVFIDKFSGHRCHLYDIESIHGSLCHIAFVYLAGRSRLPSLSNFAASFKNDEYTMRYPPPSVISDLQWWHDALQHVDVSRNLFPRGEVQDFGIYVDACTSWGIGIVIDGYWAAFQLKDDWKLPLHDICWLETVAFELLVYQLEQMGFKNAHLRVHSDNKGTIGALAKGRSRNRPINLAVRRTLGVLYPLFITPDIVYVPSAENLADPISRGDLGPTDKMLHPSFMLPDELKSFFIYE